MQNILTIIGKFYDILLEIFTEKKSFLRKIYVFHLCKFY